MGLSSCIHLINMNDLIIQLFRSLLFHFLFVIKQTVLSANQPSVHICSKLQGLFSVESFDLLRATSNDDDRDHDGKTTLDEVQVVLDLASMLKNLNVGACSEASETKKVFEAF